MDAARPVLSGAGLSLRRWVYRRLAKSRRTRWLVRDRIGPFRLSVEGLLLDLHPADNSSEHEMFLTGAWPGPASLALIRDGATGKPERPHSVEKPPARAAADAGVMVAEEHHRRRSDMPFPEEPREARSGNRIILEDQRMTGRGGEEDLGGLRVRQRTGNFPVAHGPTHPVLDAVAVHPAFVDPVPRVDRIDEAEGDAEIAQSRRDCLPAVGRAAKRNHQADRVGGVVDVAHGAPRDHLRGVMGQIRLRVHPVFLLLALAACGPVSPRLAADQCEQRARAAVGPTGEVYLGLASHTKGPAWGAEIGISSDFLAGRDPYEVYESCVRKLSGQGPIRPLDLGR